MLAAGPPGLEDELSMPKFVAQHINAIHLARENFIKCESDRVLKAALKQRVYKTAGEIFPGDWVYFKNDRRWDGPVKVTTVDGKRIYAIRANKLLTINSDNVLLAKKDGDENMSGVEFEPEQSNSSPDPDPSPGSLVSGP